MKDLLNGKTPSRIDLFEHMEEELSKEEEKLFNSIGREFISMLETTVMTKSYKMPLLETFYNNGNIKMDINKEDIYKSFFKIRSRLFYRKGRLYIFT